MPAAKRKRRLTARAQAAPVVEEREETPPPPKEEEVPTSFGLRDPLPVLKTRQPIETLPDREFKTLVESNIIAESLKRSRNMWLSEDSLFEKFWTKPLRKRIFDEKKNPSKDTMIKIGDCELQIQPHFFDVRLFAIKAPTPPAPPPPPPHQAGPQQYQMSPPNTPGMPHPQYQQGAQPPQLPNGGLQGRTLPPPVYTHRPNSPYTAQPIHPPQYMQQPHMQPGQQPGSPHQPRPYNSAAASPQTPGTPAQASGQTAAPGTPAVATPPRQDPVIQMLAQRAAADPNLKALMRIVASGKATAEELKIFQGHIDSITPIALAQAAAQQQQQGQSRPPQLGQAPVAPMRAPTPQTAGTAPAQQAPPPPQPTGQPQAPFPQRPAPITNANLPPIPVSAPAMPPVTGTVGPHGMVATAPPTGTFSTTGPPFQPFVTPTASNTPSISTPVPSNISTPSTITPPSAPNSAPPQVPPQNPPQAPTGAPTPPPIPQQPASMPGTATPQAPQHPSQQPTFRVQPQAPNMGSTAPAAPTPAPAPPTPTQQTSLPVAAIPVARVPDGVAPPSASRPQSISVNSLVSGTPTSLPPAPPMNTNPVVSSSTLPHSQYATAPPPNHVQIPQHLTMAPPYQTSPLSKYSPLGRALATPYTQTTLPPAPTPIRQQKFTQSHTKARQQDICGIVFEFTNGFGDRFLFPRNSIIEYRDGGRTLVCSFLLIKEVNIKSTNDDDDEDAVMDDGEVGEDGEKNVKKEKEVKKEGFYQPITMYFRAPSHRILEMFARVVNHPDHVREYMKSIMDNYTRAPPTYLAYRLRRSPGSLEEVQRAAPKPITTTNDRRASHAKHRSAAPRRPSQAVLPPAQPTPPPAALPAAPPPPRAPPKPKPPRSRRGRIADPTKLCHLCGTNRTSLWRKAEIKGETETVCNACGIKWKTNESRREDMLKGDIPKGPGSPGVGEMGVPGVPGVMGEGREGS